MPGINVCVTTDIKLGFSLSLTKSQFLLANVVLIG